MLAGGALLAIPLASPLFAWLSQLIATRAATAARRRRSGAFAWQRARRQWDFASWLTSLIPTNPVAAAANGAMLPLILFTLLLALAIARSRRRARETLLGFFRSLSEAMLVLVRWVVWLAPIGVFALDAPARRARRRRTRRRSRLLHRGLFDRQRAVHPAALPGRRHRRPDSGARLRARGPSRRS